MADAGKETARERELKFRVDSADVGKIGAHPLLAARIPETRRLISVYFDTEDFALRDAGVALRLRGTDEDRVQTIKVAGPTLFDRPEWEHRVGGSHPDLGAAEATGLAPFMDARVRERLRPLFKTLIERTVYHLDRNGSEIELALDQGEVEADSRRAPILEMELELKRGHPAELFRLARELAVSVPLRLDLKTKAERGYALIEPGSNGEAKAAPVRLSPDMMSVQAFRVIAQNCLRQIIANESAMCAGNAEALHQMRIGLRRLRAAIGAFAEFAAGADQKKIKSELKWVTNALGPARDLDVFVADVLQPLCTGRGRVECLADTERAFMERRAKAYAAAAGSVRSDRFRGVLLDLAEWIEVGPWTADPELGPLRECPVSEHAVHLLARLRKRICKQDKPLKEMSPSQRHKLRIRAKSMRYTIEFFAALFPGRQAKSRRQEALAALKALQDALGALNDLAARQALAADGQDLSREAMRLLTAEDGNAEGLLKAAQAAHARFARVKSFWK
ncbi:MAG: CYTH and CHAD domain-containing protein [Methyloceanibacter sp.]